MTSKFNRHLSLIKPILNVLLEETVGNPSDTMLRRILAFKKSLMSFETSVVSVEKAVNSLLSNDLDMADLYLSQDRDEHEHEEVSLVSGVNPSERFKDLDKLHFPMLVRF